MKINAPVSMLLLGIFVWYKFLHKHASKLVQELRDKMQACILKLSQSLLCQPITLHTFINSQVVTTNFNTLHRN